VIVCAVPRLILAVNNKRAYFWGGKYTHMKSHSCLEVRGVVARGVYTHRVLFFYEPHSLGLFGEGGYTEPEIQSKFPYFA
jgi:hypothetical protein